MTESFLRYALFVERIDGGMIFNGVTYRCIDRKIIAGVEHFCMERVPDAQTPRGGPGEKQLNAAPAPQPRSATTDPTPEGP